MAAAGAAGPENHNPQARSAIPGPADSAPATDCQARQVTRKRLT